MGESPSVETGVDPPLSFRRGQKCVFSDCAEEGVNEPCRIVAIPVFPGVLTGTRQHHEVWVTEQHRGCLVNLTDLWKLPRRLSSIELAI